jgi:hypothetical protein
MNSHRLNLCSSDWFTRCELSKGSKGVLCYGNTSNNRKRNDLYHHDKEHNLPDESR